MEAAGKAGVPIILADVPPAPGYEVQTSTWTQNQVEADAGTLGIIKKGDILIVRGIAGNQNDKVLYNQKVVDLKNCPDIHVAAVLYGNWDNPTAKNVVSQYLASHPQPLAGVLNDGGMFAGIVQAFEARGIKVPPVAIEQCGGGDLSWWLSKLPDYRTVGGCINGFQGGYTYFNVALRVLANKGPKYNVLSMPAVTLDNDEPEGVRQAGPAPHLQRGAPRPEDGMVRRHLPEQVLQPPGAATAELAGPRRARGRPGLAPGRAASRVRGKDERDRLPGQGGGRHRRRQRHRLRGRGARGGRGHDRRAGRHRRGESSRDAAASLRERRGRSALHVRGRRQRPRVGAGPGPPRARRAGDAWLLVNNAGVYLSAPFGRCRPPTWSSSSASTSGASYTACRPSCPGWSSATAATSSTPPRSTGWSRCATPPATSRPSTR